MTSSHIQDWVHSTHQIPKSGVGEDGTEKHKEARLNLSLPFSLLSQVEDVAERNERSIQGQIRFFIKQGLGICARETKNLDSSLHCDGVSVREGGESPKQVNNVRSTSTQSLTHNQECGDGVGGECENPPRKNRTNWPKDLDPCLEEFREQILAFWNEKRGKKSQAAWKLLNTELSKIHAHLNVGRSPQGRETFLEQLELAAAQGFQSITLKNFKQFAEGKATAGAPAEPQHPASRVFRASDQNWPSIGGAL